MLADLLTFGWLLQSIKPDRKAGSPCATLTHPDQPGKLFHVWPRIGEWTVMDPEDPSEPLAFGDRPQLVPYLAGAPGDGIQRPYVMPGGQPSYSVSDGILPDSKQLDISSPAKEVEIKVASNGRVIWINVDGQMALRVCRIPEGALKLDIPNPGRRVPK